MEPMYPPQAPPPKKGKRKLRRSKKPMLKKNPRLNAIAQMLEQRGGGR